MRLETLVERVAGRDRPVRLVEARGSAGAFAVAELRRALAGPLLVVTSSAERARDLASDLRAFTGGSVEVLPPYDVPPFDRFSAHPEIEARRMSLLYALLGSATETPLTLVAPWSALLRRVLPREELRARVTHLERGMTVDRDALVEVLASAGYQRRSLVEERGELAIRGAILDLFPPQLDGPVRLEFEFDDVASIRRFDPVTQRSDAELRAIVAIPPRGLRLPGDLDALLHRVRERGRAADIPESNIYAVTEPLARRHLPPGIENLEALFHDSMETVLDYLPGAALLVVDDPEAGRQRAREHLEEVFEGHARAAREDRLVCDPLELYATDDSAEEEVRRRRPLLLDPLASLGGAEEVCLSLGARDHSELRREVEDQRGSGRALAPLLERLEAWKDAGRRIRVACPSLSSAQRLADILRDYRQEIPIAKTAGLGAPPERGSARIEIARVHRGFELPAEGLVMLTEEDVFGARRQPRYARVRPTGESIERLAQIQEGDRLVHAEHGIALYGGLVQLHLAGVAQEMLLLLYGGGDKLYVPVSRLDRVHRYTGGDGAPPVDRLGGGGWQRARARAKRAVQDIAAELIATSAARELMKGFAYPPPDADYEEFEAGFRYEDTPDQRRATGEVLADLRAERPMDRLVCGDVGFGKTEIACRAAYLVASSGRQVAVLVPTTVLCQQHLKTFRERFAQAPLEIAGLSRLSSPKEVKQTREGLSSGRVDIVIGTHRLLSKDVHFRNLGLLIVDEEHRFGVRHKERLKAMRKLVDVLTLSATPIPRTLQMALSGMRDLSVMATPPPDRIAVRTQVCRLSEEIVRDAILREMRRGGQTFFVHNRVETIDEIAAYVRGLVPEARIEIAHGQMPEQRLERVMLRFLEGELDVLVCTAIIESGLDIPNANTILIHRADQFGLAQLYQLRGRVGRSDRSAYAYLFLPPEGSMTEDARRRIEAIQDLSELGAGFRLATHDLEIRGAGNLLGAEQSGQVAAVGYDLYMEMLEQAIAELRGQRIDEALEPEIRLPLPALLPEAYVPEVGQRLVLYKQLSATRDVSELESLRAELLDRFGPLPPETQNLLDVIRLKIRCRELGIASVEASARELKIEVAESTRIDPRQLVALLERPGCPIRLAPEHGIRMPLRRREDALAESFGVLDLLAPHEEAARPRAAGEAL